MSDPHASGQAGQEGRPQYAEFDPNTLPQVSYGTDPEVLFAPIEPDVAYHVAGQEPAPPAVVDNEGAKGLKGIWSKRRGRKVMWGVGLAFAVCVILAIGISVPLVGNRVGKEEGDDGVSSLSASSQTTSSSTTRSTTSSSTSSSTKATTVPGCERDKYTTDVDWVGIRDGGGGWDFELRAAGSAPRCCAYCYKAARECNAWLYVPSGKGAVPDCTLVVGYEGGGGDDDADDECPGGRPGVIFNTVEDKPGNAAGGGPCAEDVEL